MEASKCLFQYLTALYQLNSRRPKSLTLLHIFADPKSKYYFSCLCISLIYVFATLFNSLLIEVQIRHLCFQLPSRKFVNLHLEIYLYQSFFSSQFIQQPPSSYFTHLKKKFKLLYTFKILNIGTSLMAQQLRICLPMQGTQVQSQNRKLRFYMPQGN